jgi:hypothetical protein
MLECQKAFAATFKQLTFAAWLAFCPQLEISLSLLNASNLVCTFAEISLIYNTCLHIDKSCVNHYHLYIQLKR